MGERRVLTFFFRSKCRSFRSDGKGKSSEEQTRTSTKEDEKLQEGEKVAFTASSSSRCFQSRFHNF
ncbi:hypothetical protein KFK09_020538 [Dendrobium nobile]|uniref:Uncharacterized protein n=1 Tax=Dendrobium nobile TaxID=94219 RepID=A0A8T3AT96_DENNO|nr:hypothetical protein KFK09_020538 [Dendrobium nobile]